MDALSMIFLSAVDEEEVDKNFSMYVSIFLEEKFQKSDQKNVGKYEKKVI
jgi:hypothetical protein